LITEAAVATTVFVHQVDVPHADQQIAFGAYVAAT
jgi:hypothetical protein